MNLRSGRQLGASSRSDTASKVPTIGSGTRSVGNLETIREDLTSLDTDSDNISSSESEMSIGGRDARPSQSQQSRDMHARGGSNQPTTSNPFIEIDIELEYNIALKYITTNVRNAYIYKDPWGQFTVKLADARTPFEAKPWVNYQGDSYMGMQGERYLFTKEPWDVDNLGCTTGNHRANQRANQPGTSAHNPKAPEGKIPSDSDAWFEDLWKDANLPSESKKEQKNSNQEKNKNKGKMRVEVINMDRLLHDWNDREVYQDQEGNFFMTPKHPMDQLLDKHVIYEETWGSSEPEYKDDLRHRYVKLGWDEIVNLTFNSISLYADISSRATAKPDETAFSGEIVSQKPRLFEEHQVTGNRNITQGSTGRPSGTSKSRPTMPGRTELRTRQPSGTKDRRYGIHSAPREPPRLPPRIPEDPFCPRREGHGRRIDDEYSRKVRPSALQKLVKKYDGFGDPYDHIASFRQVVHAEQVRDTHTKIEGFGLTLEGKALSWFQTLDSSKKDSQESLEEDFVATFSKMGIKHNVVAKIHAFKQAAYKSVRDCANRMKQYIARCPEEEKPSQK